MAIVLERQQTTRGFDGKEKTSGEWKFQFFHQTMSDQTLFILRGKKKRLSVKPKFAGAFRRQTKFPVNRIELHRPVKLKRTVYGK